MGRFNLIRSKLNALAAGVITAVICILLVVVTHAILDQETQVAGQYIASMAGGWGSTWGGHGPGVSLFGGRCTAAWILLSGGTLGAIDLVLVAVIPVLYALTCWFNLELALSMATSVKSALMASFTSKHGLYAFSNEYPVVGFIPNKVASLIHAVRQLVSALQLDIYGVSNEGAHGVARATHADHEDRVDPELNESIREPLRGRGALMDRHMQTGAGLLDIGETAVLAREQSNESGPLTSESGGASSPLRRRSSSIESH